MKKNKAAIAAVVGAALGGMMTLSMIMGGGAISATALSGGAENIAEIGIEEYLTGDGGDREGAKYWNWTVGGGFQNGHDTAWCACFVSWCGNEAGLYEDGYTTKNEGCAGWVEYYKKHKKKGEVHGPNDTSYEPQVGDIVVYGTDKHHIGIVAGTSDSDTEYIDSLLGSTSDEGVAGKRKKHLREMLKEVVKSKNEYLTVEGNTSDRDATSSEGNSLGVHAKSRSDMTYVIHTFAPKAGVSGSGEFDKYTLTGDELEQIASLCYQEQGSAKGAAAEASLMANRYEMSSQKNRKSLYSYVRTCGWWAQAPKHMDRKCAPKSVVKAVRSVLCDGKRTLPKYIDEHDCISDLTWISTGSRSNRSDYHQFKTLIENRYGSSYVFYCFPTPGADPFGYTSESNREKYGDDCYSIEDE